MPDNLDPQFLNQLKKGDIKAFEQVVRQYEKPIYGYIFSLVGHRQDAEDITQAVFIKLYKNLGHIELDKNFKNWLYKIATNTAYDWLRTKQKNPELFIIDDEENEFETIDEHATYLTIEANVDLEKAFKNIKPIYKQAILLFYYEGFSYEEIAAILALPLNTVKTHLRRAKEAVRQALENNYYE